VSKEKQVIKVNAPANHQQGRISFLPTKKEITLCSNQFKDRKNIKRKKVPRYLSKVLSFSPLKESSATKKLR